MPAEVIQVCNEFGWWRQEWVAVVLVFGFAMGIWSEHIRAKKRRKNLVDKPD